MAKINFNKFGLKPNQEIVNVTYADNIVLEIKQYLSVNDKLKMMGEVLTNTMDQNNFVNPIKRTVFVTLGVIEYYTNITFTEKQKSDPVKLYDALCNSELFETIIANIPDAELRQIYDGVDGIIAAYYQYNNSILGVLENIKNNYDATELNIGSLMSEINDPQAFEILKQIAPAITGLNQSN